jgi:hypothetical protein
MTTDLMILTIAILLRTQKAIIIHTNSITQNTIEMPIILVPLTQVTTLTTIAVMKALDKDNDFYKPNCRPNLINYIAINL